MRCADCNCVSESAEGWVAILRRGVEERSRQEVVAFCPPCAAREFRYAATAAAGYE